MKIGSLCSGYGGLEEGVRSVLGGDVVWQSEIDPGALKILAHRYPGVPNIGDMTQVDWAQVEPVDVLVGGTPCQDLSHAGKRQGMTEGTRSNLWVAMREAIAQLRPPLVVWENVRGAFSARADSELESREGLLGVVGDGPVLRTLGRVLGDLSDLGFDAEWVGLRAADVGAPHGRFRVFVAAWPADAIGSAGPVAGCVAPGSAEGTPAEAGRRAGRGSGALASHTDGAAGGERRIAAPGQAEGGRARADAGGRGGAPAAHASGDGRHEGRPEPARLLGGPDAAVGGDAADADHSADDGQWARTEPRPGGAATPDADSAGFRRLEEHHAATEARERASHRYDPDGLAVAAGGVDWGPYGPAIARWERCLGRTAPSPTERGRNGQPRLSPAFVEWLMGLPAGWVTDVPGITRNEALKALGNGVVPQQCAMALRLLLGNVEVAA